MMEILTLSSWLSILLNSFYIGFTLFTIICLVLRLFRKTNIARQADNTQYAVNLAFAFGIILMLLYETEFYYLLYFGDRESFIFRRPNPVAENILLVSNIVFLFIGLLFFFPRFRQSWILSLLVLLAINAEHILYMIGPYYSNYSPAIWEEYYRSPWYIKTGEVCFFTLITSILYISLSKRQKLPYS
jgi:hypothetical protein